MKMDSAPEKATYIMAKKMTPFIDAENVKECFIAVVEIVCTEEQSVFITP